MHIGYFKIQKRKIKWLLVETDDGFDIVSISIKNRDWVVVGVVVVIDSGLIIKSRSGRRGRPATKKVPTLQDVIDHLQVVCHLGLGKK